MVSNSDCHSFWPWRIGREANVFELSKFTYKEITSAISTNDPARFKFTIETDPAYGKYHWTGHRNCKLSMAPSEARKLGKNCPICRRKLTKGVEQRIEELADRPLGYKREDVPKFMRLLPLSEIIAAVIGSAAPSTQAVWKPYNALIEKFSDEYSVLIDASLEEMALVVGPTIAQAIIRVRDGTVKVTPGYDGVYGQLDLGIESLPVRDNASIFTKVQQRSMSDYW